jgi:hypothetical protein
MFLIFSPTVLLDLWLREYSHRNQLSVVEVKGNLAMPLAGQRKGEVCRVDAETGALVEQMGASEVICVNNYGNLCNRILPRFP